MNTLRPVSGRAGSLLTQPMRFFSPRFVAGRHVLQPVIDSAVIAISVIAASYLRFDFSIPARHFSGLFVVVPIFVVIQLLCCAGAGLYAQRWAYGSFEEVAALAPAVLVSVGLTTLVDVSLLDHRVPVSVCLASGPIALVTMAAVRFLWRLRLERRLRPDGTVATRVIVFGAGEGGYQLITSMMRNPQSPWFPVALIDDAPSLRNRIVRGVPVSGDRSQIGDVAKATRATALVIAVPSAGGELLRELSEVARAADMVVLVVPPVTELLGDSIGVEDIRPVTEADLLGRHEIDIDIDSIAEYLTGRRVLVTGAGGSIGSELCRQIYRFNPAELVMLDRDESSLHAVQLSIEGRAMLDSRNLAVCDIRDRERLSVLFAEHRPQVVFHAAALKHLPLLQMHPAEAVKTNVFGTQNMLDVSRRFDVDRFVNISTDKAADPSSVLGFSKRIAERLTAAAAQYSDGAYLSVRFGNVLGSRGSVLTAFHSQIKMGGPVTVTHPDVTRYFMTIEEAVKLVIQAGAIGRAGEALVLDMGEPVRIVDVATRLIDQDERHIDIAFTGLRNGEKLHEVLFSKSEGDYRPIHELISHVRVPPLEPERIQDLRTDGSDRQVITLLRTMCGDSLPDLPDLDLTNRTTGWSPVGGNGASG